MGEPTEFSATSAPTMSPSPKSTELDPMPPLRLPAIAPRPAPTDPKANSASAAADARMPSSRYGGESPQLLSPPFARSCNTAAGYDRYRRRLLCSIANQFPGWRVLRPRHRRRPARIPIHPKAPARARGRPDFQGIARQSRVHQVRRRVHRRPPASLSRTVLPSLRSARAHRLRDRP